MPTESRPGRASDEEASTAIRPDLAVVLCTYNGAEFVGQQVSSIVRQTVLPGSLQVYDDGSSDDTVRILSEAFAARPSTAEAVELVIHLSDGSRYGAAGNFMRGLRATAAALVALADQDDVWMPERLGRAVELLDSDPSILLVASNAMFIDGHGGPLGRTTLEAQRLTDAEAAALGRRETLGVLTRRNIVPGMTFTARRELADELDDLPGVMHDYRLAVRAAARGRLVVLKEPLVEYRIHGANAVGLDAGNRSLVERFRARRDLIRSPLTDLEQWVELVGSLRADDPVGHLHLALDKLDFERRRRFIGQRGISRVLALLRLVRSGDYSRFDVGGWRGAVKDFLRPSATDAAPVRRVDRPA